MGTSMRSWRDSVERVRGTQRHFACPQDCARWLPSAVFLLGGEYRAGRSPGMQHGQTLIPPIPDPPILPFTAPYYLRFSLGKPGMKLK